MTACRPTGKGAETRGATDRVVVYSPPRLPGVELMQAHLVTHAFPRHIHEELTVAVTTGGEGTYLYRGARHSVTRDDISVFGAGEVHAGGPAPGRSWCYRMYYFGSDLVSEAARELGWPDGVQPHFPAAVIRDRQLAHLLLELHDLLRRDPPGPDPRPWTIWALQALVHAHAEPEPEHVPDECDAEAMQRVRDHIDAHHAESLSIDTLSQLVDLSPSHLVRSFHATYGMPPITYQTAVRIVRAKDRLRQGHPIAHVAVDMGFYDQSHFHRVFKRITGVTPGRYQAAAASAQADFD